MGVPPQVAEPGVEWVVVGTSRFTDDEVRAIRAEHARGVSQKALAERYACAKGTIHYIVRRITWTHI